MRDLWQLGTSHQRMARQEKGNSVSIYSRFNHGSSQIITERTVRRRAPILTGTQGLDSRALANEKRKSILINFIHIGGLEFGGNSTKARTSTLKAGYGSVIV